MVDFIPPTRSRLLVTEGRQSRSDALSTMLIAALVIAGLYFGRDIFVPVAIAVLLSLILAPLVRLLRHWHMGRVISVIIVVGLAFLVIFGIGTIIANEGRQLVTDLPKYEETIVKKIDSVRGAATETDFFKRATLALRNLSTQLADGNPQATAGAPAAPAPSGAANNANSGQPIPVEVHQQLPGSLEIIEAVITSILAPLATTGIVFVYVVFILVQREDLRDRLIRLAGSRDLPRATAAIDDAARRLSRYFLAQTAVNAGFGVLTAVGLSLIGVPSAILWGILAGLMRFVPYIGSLIAAAFPLLLAAAVDPGWGMVLATLALFLIAEPIVGQVVEPMLFGHSTGLSPIAVIVSATLWTWLWGPIGLVLATPLTACLVVLGRHVEQLQFFDVMLGDTPPLSPIESFYQRMLGGHAAEATERAEQALKSQSLADFYDEVVLPALQLADSDRREGRLGLEQQEKIRDTMVEVIDNLAAEPDAPPPISKEHEEPIAGLAPEHRQSVHTDAKESLPTKNFRPAIMSSSQNVLCIAVHTPLDEAAASILAQLVEKHGARARVVAPDILTPQAVARLSPEETSVLCLSCLDSSSGVAELRYIVRRLRRRLPKTLVLIGWWMSDSSEERMRAVCAQTTADLCVASMAQAIEHIIGSTENAEVENDATPAEAIA